LSYRFRISPRRTLWSLGIIIQSSWSLLQQTFASI
jgi:hypothetical protein